MSSIKKKIQLGRKLMDSLKKQVKSSAMAENYLTLKLFPTSDKDFLGWAEGDEPHGQVLKQAFVAEHQWASAFKQSLDQLNEWRESLGQDKLEVAYDDVLFVQNLKDEKGRQVDVAVLNRVTAQLGFSPVTPGFFVKERDEDGNLMPYAKWLKSVFATNKELRARSRGMATTPFTSGLNRDLDGNRVRYFLTNIENQGQVGADGGNEYSMGLNLGAGHPIFQIRVHTPLVEDAEGNVAPGFQAKGKAHATCTQAVRYGDRWLKLTPDEIKYRDLKGQSPDETVDAFFIHYDNVKGSLKDAVEAKGEALQGLEIIDLQEWWFDCYAPTVGHDHRLFTGGVIAEDNPQGSSSVAWQDAIIRSAGALLLQENEFRGAIRSSLERLYELDNPIVEKLFEGAENVDALKASAASLGAISPGKVAHTVYGQGHKVKTMYCDQISMPSDYCILKKMPKKTEKVSTEGVEFDAVAVTGQPQLYHACLITQAVITHKSLTKVFDFAKKVYFGLEHDSGELSRQGQQFYGDLCSFIYKEIGSESTAFALNEAVYLRLRAIWISLEASPNLIWMSKQAQDRLQRDSDGDRLLVEKEAWRVRAVKIHEEATRNLPVPKIEVNHRDSRKDGNLKVLDAPCFEIPDGVTKAEVANFICAPNQGQGPTGTLVNLCSAVLAHIVWRDTNGAWGPDPRVREWALKFYAFLCFLVQNSIDRTKKPAAVASLLCWLQLSDAIFERAIVSDKDYVVATMDESFPRMEIAPENPGANVHTRLSVDEQYNVGVLKLFVCWAINFINAGYQFPSADDWASKMEAISEAMATANADDLKPMWEKIKEILGDDREIKAIENSWVFPERAYAWIKETSLEVPLRDAPPAAKLMSEWTVEENQAVKCDLGITGQPLRAIHEHYAIAFADPKKANAASSAYHFLQKWFSYYKQVKAGEYASMAQSEYFNARGDNDANDMLDKLKQALEMFDDTENQSVVYKAALRAFKPQYGDGSKRESLEMLSELFFHAWGVFGYEQYLMARSPLDWLAMKLAVNSDEVEVARNSLNSDESGDETFLSRLLAVFPVVGNGSKAQATWESLKAALVAAYERQHPVSFSDLLNVTNVGQVTASKVMVDVNKLLADNTKDIWPEWLWSDVYPAIAVQAEVVETSDVKHRYFVESSGIDKLLLAVQADCFESYTQEFYQELLSSYLLDNADLFKSDDEFVKVKQDDKPNLTAYMLGALKERDLLPSIREVIQAGAPIMQAMRLSALIKTQQGGQLTGEELSARVASYMVHTRVVEGVDSNGIDTVKKFHTLRGRVDYPVSSSIIVNMAAAMLEHGSLYLLQPVRNIYVRKNKTLGDVTRTTKRWVLHSGVQYRLEERLGAFLPGRMQVMLELETGFGIGHCYSATELKLYSHPAVLKAVFKEDTEKLEMVKKYLEHKLNMVETGALVRLDHKLVNQEDGNALITQGTVVPYHWGGSFKADINSPFGHRVSAYRPIWRFIMAALNDQTTFVKDGNEYRYTEDALKDRRFRLFEDISGASFSRKSKFEGSGLEAFAELVAESGNGSRHPSRNPCSKMVKLNGETAYMKILPSPFSDSFGNILWSSGDQLATYHDLDAEAPRQYVFKSGGEVEVFDSAPVASYVRNSICTPFVSKVNGVKAPYHILQDIKAALTASDGLTVSLYELTVPYEVVAEFVIGLMHFTSAFDSYVLSNFQEHSSRLGAKTPSALRRFFRLGDEINVKLPSPQALIALIDVATTEEGC
jgi:hypothetical protein